MPFLAVVAILAAILTGMAYAVALVLALVLLPFRLIRWLVWPKDRNTRTITIHVQAESARQLRPMVDVTPARPGPSSAEAALFRLGQGMARLRLAFDPDAWTRSAPPLPAPALSAPPRPEEHHYFQETEALFAAWLKGRPEGGALARRLFTLEHAPEPYLLFGEPGRRCVFVSTNPGKGFSYQLSPRANPESLFAGQKSFAEAAVRLGRFYARPDAPISPSARTNISAMIRIARLFGAAQVMQVEAVPWHSSDLQEKDINIPALRDGDAAYRRYWETMSAFLATEERVFAWSAVTYPDHRDGAGLRLKAASIGLDLNAAHFLPLDRKGAEVSQALYWLRTGRRIRGVFVNKGSATLPASKVNRNGQDKDALISSILD